MIGRLKASPLPGKAGPSRTGLYRVEVRTARGTVKGEMIRWEKYLGGFENYRRIKLLRILAFAAPEGPT
jgi:hypothetical protein